MKKWSWLFGFATMQIAYAEVVWLDATKVTEGTKDNPVVVAGAITNAIGSLEITSTGALRLVDEAAITMSNGTQKVNGYLELNDSALMSSTASFETSKGAGASSEIVLNGGKLEAAGVVFGADGESVLAITGGALGVIGNKDIKFASATNAVVTMTANGGAIVSAYHVYWGYGGKCVAYLNEGFTIADIGKYWSIAENAGSKAEVCVNGCTWSGGGSQHSRIGYSGEGLLHVKKGRAVADGLNIGYNATGNGTLIVEKDGVVRIGNNSVLIIGGSGDGKLLLRGGRVEPISSSASMKVRQSDVATATGVLRGWGVWDCGTKKSPTSDNNGLVIADGKDEAGGVAERTLAISCVTYTNSIDNVTTNGWYAANKGLLSLEHSVFSLPVGITGVCTWGEAETDDEIDLVNSARITFNNIETKISSFTGKLYAVDRSDVPAMTAGKVPVGVWKFDINGAYDSADVEFRYDHVLAPKGVTMFQYDNDMAAWVKRGGTLLPNHRVKVEGVDPTKMFAAVPLKYGLMVYVR